MKEKLKCFLSIFIKLFWIFPIKDKRISFQSFCGDCYNDNPKAISDALKNKGVELIWIVHTPTKFDDSDVKFVKKHSIKCLYYLATSKIWIDNCRKPFWIRKRRKQYYIQTWHAGISNKLGEKKTENMLSKEYLRDAKHDSSIADLFLSNSSWLTNSYRECFWYSGEVLEKGLPREDVLVGNYDEFHKKVCAYYNLSPQTHIILYAPTFRNDGKLDAYDLDYKALIEYMEKNGDEWVLLVRLHSNIRNTHRLQYNSKILNGSIYQEINDLIMASDIVISDYSSCLFDAMLAGRKVIVYASDIEQYEKERGFAFSWEELPFPIARTNEELIHIISQNDNEEYKFNVQKFKEKCGIVELGNASNAVADHIMRIITSK
jgi:CDP-glycerol glycerophosphotransferase